MRAAKHEVSPVVLILVLLAASCSPAAVPTYYPTQIPAGAALMTSQTSMPAALASTATALQTALVTSTPEPSRTSTPGVDSLEATVVADLLSCRYGPGPDYLFLYGLRKGANIKLIGRTDGDNWHWVYVDGRNKCWVNATFIEIKGDLLSLPVVYPGLATLPVSPTYPPTTVLKVTRQRNQVTVIWSGVPLRPGDEEDASMQHYILEIWRCEGSQLLFDELGTNDLSIMFVDEPGCQEASRGRIFVQEKHGLAGPTEIPWPSVQ